MGEVFRRFWMPAILSSEVEPDGPPRRLRMLGEDLVAFRNTRGAVGILAEYCRHRFASLFFGRNEESGLRCAYHGWKYDVSGNCVDIPSVPVYSLQQDRRISIAAYPTYESGGVVWVYMGPVELQPPTPLYEWTLLPQSHSRAMRRLIECNWLQCVEGALDVVHTALLHRGTFSSDPLLGSTRGAGLLDLVPVVDAFEADDGLVVSSRRDAGDGSFYWRFSRFIVPCFTIGPPSGEEAFINFSAFVPRDDETCIRWTIACHALRPLNDSERAALIAGGANHVAIEPISLRALANRDNEYRIDRDAQRKGETYSGVHGIALQDQAMQEHQGPGPIVDRSGEYLVLGDKSLIATRDMLLDVVKTVAAGRLPPGREAEAQKVRAGATIAGPEMPASAVLAGGFLRTELGKPVMAA